MLMGRGAFVFVAVMGLMPDACAKLMKKSPPPEVDAPPVIPSVTATAPPTYQPPEPPGLPAPAPVTSPELTKAKEASDKKDYRKVKALLEKKVKAGKANREEAELLMDACSILRDKVCTDMVKKAHPEVAE